MAATEVSGFYGSGIRDGNRLSRRALCGWLTT